MYGFSPYMVGESFAHVEFLFLPLPPFIALVVTSILQGRGSPPRLGILLGFLLAGQYLISPEIFASVALFTVAAVFLVAVRRPGRAFETVGRLLRPVGLALVVTAALLAYPVWMMVAGLSTPREPRLGRPMPSTPTSSASWSRDRCRGSRSGCGRSEIGSPVPASWDRPTATSASRF